MSGKLKFRIRSIQDQLFLLLDFLFLEIFKFCSCYKVLQILFYFVTLSDFYKNFVVVYGTGFSRECYVYSGKLILFSKFCFEIKNNIYKKPNVYVSEKFEIFTLFFIQLCIKWIQTFILSYKFNYLAENSTQLYLTITYLTKLKKTDKNYSLILFDGLSNC